MLKAEIKAKFSNSEIFNFSVEDHMQYYDTPGTFKTKDFCSKFLQIFFSKGKIVSPFEVIIDTQYFKSLNNTEFKLFRFPS